MTWFGSRGIKPYLETTLNIDRVSAKISCLFSEHKNSNASTTRQQVPSSAQSWIPPSCLSFKIKVDATVGPYFSSMAAVVRDWRGELVFVNIMKVNTTLPLQAEVEAIKWGLSLAPAIGNECIIVESNCQYCVQLLNDLASPPPLEDQVLVLRFEEYGVCF